MDQCTEKLKLGGRSGTIGGTSWGAVLGMSRFKTPYDIWARCLGYEDRKPQNAAMARGLRLEPIVSALAEGVLGLELRTPEVETQRWPEPYTNFTASVDRLGYAGDYVGPVELKTMSSYGSWEGAGPPEYRLQLQSYIWFEHLKAVVFGQKPVTEGFLVCLQASEEVLSMIQTVPQAHHAVAVGAAKLHAHAYDRDPVFFDTVIPYVLEWWDRHVEAKEPPPPDATDGCTAALRKHFGFKDDLVLDAGPELEALVREREETKGQIAELTENKKILDNKIREELRGAKCAESEAVKVSVAMVEGRMKFETARFKEENPELHATYLTRGAGHERLTVKIKGA